jgi:hypothetical protein
MNVITINTCHSRPAGTDPDLPGRGRGYLLGDQARQYPTGDCRRLHFYSYGHALRCGYTHLCTSPTADAHSDTDAWRIAYPDCDTHSRCPGPPRDIGTYLDPGHRHA